MASMMPSAGSRRLHLAIVAVCLALTLLSGIAAAERNRFLVVLDASSSMAEKRSGETRFTTALRAAQQAVDRLPADTLVGVRLYGGRVGLTKRAESCRDSSLVMPFTLRSLFSLTSVAAQIHPQGFSPIAEALRQAGNDFGAGAGRHDLLLLSDGDDTCDGDPLAAARALSAAGVQLRVQTVAYRGDVQGRRSLADLAALTGGEAFVAADDSALSAVLEQAMHEVLYPTNPLGDLDGSVDAGSDEASALQLEPRAYRRSSLNGVDAIDTYLFRQPAGTKVQFRVRLAESVAEPVQFVVADGREGELIALTLTGDQFTKTDPVAMPVSGEVRVMIRCEGLAHSLVYQLEPSLFTEVG